jgi:hypothetical protein
LDASGFDLQKVKRRPDGDLELDGARVAALINAEPESDRLAHGRFASAPPSRKPALRIWSAGLLRERMPGDRLAIRFAETPDDHPCAPGTRVLKLCILISIGAARYEFAASV